MLAVSDVGSAESMRQSRSNPRQQLTSTASLRPSASPTIAHPCFGTSSLRLIVHPDGGKRSRAEERAAEPGVPKRCIAALGGRFTKGTASLRVTLILVSSAGDFLAWCRVKYEAIFPTRTGRHRIVFSSSRVYPPYRFIRAGSLCMSSRWSPRSTLRDSTARRLRCRSGRQVHCTYTIRGCKSRGMRGIISPYAP